MFHVKHDGLTSAAAASGVNLSEAVAEQLVAYEQLLAVRAAELGLVARSDLPRVRERHIVDCLRATLAVGPDDRFAVDLGSGGGLPGMVVAIACPDLTVTLAERRQNRGAFLELAVRELGVRNARVAVGPVKELSPGSDLCFARAFADARGSWEAAQRILGPGGRLVYFAGAGTAKAEIPEDARVEILPPPPFASGGPLVIMSRQ
jgi:16S rRNA (guanine527-N7)-methyltransferase